MVPQSIIITSMTRGRPPMSWWVTSSQTQDRIGQSLLRSGMVSSSPEPWDIDFFLSIANSHFKKDISWVVLTYVYIYQHVPLLLAGRLGRFGGHSPKVDVLLQIGSTDSWRIFVLHALLRANYYRVLIVFLLGNGPKVGVLSPDWLRK